MESKKINQLATAVNPSTSDLAIIGDPVTGVSKKITWLQVSTLIGTAANLQQVTDNGATTTNPVTIGGLTITGLSTGVLKSDSGVISSVPFGAANGVATLAGDGKVPSNQLPSYVDDVVEVANYAALPVTGETGKIYITLDNNKVYRWGGSVYVEVAANQAVWGSITGTLANQTDLQNVLNLKATDSLVVHLAGTETITGTKTFSNPSKNDGGILLQNGSSYSLSGYMNLGGMTDGLRFTSGGGISNYFALPSSVGYTYTFPAISGTIVAISGGNSTQYIDGTGALQTFPTLLSSDNLVKLVRNNSGATMTAGTIVYINGALGNKPTIAKALATGDSTSAQTYGLVQSNIANNADGYVVVIGNITDIDTSALTEGQQLYLSGTTAGAYTTTKPYAPTHLVYVGIVLRSHPTQGIIGVKIQNGYEMDELHNVDAQSPSNNDILSYNTSTSLWEHKQIATTLGFTPISLSSLSATSPLSYNNTTGAFSIQVATASQNGYLSSTDWSTFNNKQAALGGTGFVKISGSTISYDNSTYYLASNPSGFITLASLSAGAGISYSNITGVISSTITQYTDALARAAFSESVVGLDYSSSTGVLSTTTGYAIPTTAKQTEWDTAYTNRITSLTTTGTSGAATLVSNTLNIPQYQAALTNPVTGTGANGRIAFWNSGTSISGNDTFYYDSGNDKVRIATNDFGTTAAKLLVGTYLSNGSSAIAQFNGFIRIKGQLIIHNDTDINLSASLTCDANNSIIFDGTTIKASAIVKTGGTSSQFLKADGSVDTSTYLTTSSAASTYVPYTGATANVELGNNKLIAGSVTINPSVGEAQVNIKQTTTGNTIYDGYSSIWGVGTNFYIAASAGGANSKSFYFELGSLTNNTTRVYTLPNANGTIALTSNLSSYVPYTGATGSVNLGSNNLLLGSGNAGGHIDLVGTTDTAYINIESAGCQVNYNSSRITTTDKQFGGTFTLDLRPSLVTGNAFIQYFQPVTGTIALTSQIPSLSGYVTGTGVSGRIPYWNSSSSITSDSSFYFDSEYKRLRIGTTAFGASNTTKLLVGDIITSGSSAIAQFNGFVRLVGTLIIHNDANTALEGSFVCNGSNSLITLSTFEAASFIKTGGTSSQYLKADGSVSTLTNPVTGTGAANRIAYWDASSSITSSSTLTWDGTKMGIGEAAVTGEKLRIKQSGDNYFVNMIQGISSLFSIVAAGTAINDGYGIMSVGNNGYDRIVLNANGNSYITSNPTFSSGGNYGLNISHTIAPSSSTFNNGGTFAASNNYQQINWSSSSATLNTGAVIAGFNAINRNQFTAASVSISVSQAGTGIRAVSAFQILQQTGGSYAGTISHGASMFIQGIYPTNTSTTTFTNYYGLLINALDEWQGSLPYISLTNRWGIYQAGASDKNYFAGMVGIGIQPTLPLHVSGTGAANSIMTNTTASFGNANALNVGDDGTNTMIGVGNSGTKLIVLKRNAGVYAEMVRFDNDGSTSFQENSSGVSINTIGEIRLGNAKPLRGLTTTGSQFRLISIEADNQIYLAGNGGNVYINGGGGLGINTTNGIPSAAKLVLGDTLSGYGGSSAISQINGFIRIQGSIIFHESANVANQVSVYCSAANTFYVDGTLSKSSGSFRIEHPLESKKGFDLVHSFVEGPQADNIYRGKINLINGKATINIDKKFGMTEGTFAALNRDIQCFTLNEQGWDLVRGNVYDNILTIESNNPNCNDEISWIVIGERQDKHMLESSLTDENGKVILEPTSIKRIKQK